MGSPLICDLDPGHGAANFLVTNLDTQDAKAMCAADFARLGLEIAVSLLPAEEIIARATAAPATAGANGEDQPAARPARKRKAPSTPRRRPATAVEGVAEPPPPAADR